MSKLIYLCSRHGADLVWAAQDVSWVFGRLTPDNLAPRPPRMIEGEGLLIGILNPSDALPVRDYSVCMGALFDCQEDWWRPGAKVPDGSYALFRGDRQAIELVSDIVASRTIWYVKTDDLFMAATSQRALVCFLRSYEPNVAAYPWMISSGTLGPGLSWDRRIRCLAPDTRLWLDRSTWQIRVEQRPIVFEPEALPRAVHERLLIDALEETFAHMDLDPRQWVLPLSGGYDSRAILLLLKNRTEFKAVTWGLSSALADKVSDAWVARKLTRYFGLTHEYYETDLSSEPVERIFERFLVAGEGRVDHISGYMDGFALWRHLFEGGCQGVLRGDQAFGRALAGNDSDIRHRTGFTYLSDYKNVQDLDIFRNCAQSIPQSLSRQAEESLQDWSDRLFQGFRHPVVLAALNDLKCAYVEIADPLLSRRIVQRVRRIPDEIRTDKGLYRDIVRDRSPAIAFAEHIAINPAADILKDTRIISHITEYLHSHDIQFLCDKSVLTYIDTNLLQAEWLTTSSRSTAKNLKRLLKLLFSKSMLNTLRCRIGNRNENGARNIDIYRLVFRIYVICWMHSLLIQDAKS